MTSRAAVVLLGVLLAGCADAPPPREESAPATSPAPLAAPSSSPVSSPPASSSTQSPSATPRSSPPSSRAAAPRREPLLPPLAKRNRFFPPQAMPGAPGTSARLWAAYVVVGSEGDPGLAAARDELRRTGYAAGVSAAACDEGAAAGLGATVRERSLTVAVYFHSGLDAQRFVDAYAPGTLAHLEVRPGCL